jgi:hypothetical protein
MGALEKVNKRLREMLMRVLTKEEQIVNESG